MYASRKQYNFIGKYDASNFEIQLIKDKLAKHINFAPPLTAGTFMNTSDGLVISLKVGVKRPYWFWKLTRLFLYLFLAGFIIIPFLGMTLEGIPFSEMMSIGSFFILALPFVTLTLFAIFDFGPLALARKTQKRTVDILLEEFRAI